MSGAVRGHSTVKLLDCTEFYVTIGVGDGSRAIALANIQVSFDSKKNCLELQERYD